MIRYRSGYKYQLAENFETEVSWHLLPPNGDIDTEYISLRTEKLWANHAAGLHNVPVLRIKAGYAWDGPSGPTWDTPSTMTGSLIHDALYQLLREGHLPDDTVTRMAADLEFRKQCKRDGMSWWRRLYMYRAVRRFAASAASPGNKREVRTAP